MHSINFYFILNTIILFEMFEQVIIFQKFEYIFILRHRKKSKQTSDLLGILNFLFYK